jgi:phospholipase/carboxylesterase
VDHIDVDDGVCVTNRPTIRIGRIEPQRRAQVRQACVIAPGGDAGQRFRVGIGWLPMQVRESGSINGGVFASPRGDLQNHSGVRQAGFQDLLDGTTIARRRWGRFRVCGRLIRHGAHDSLLGRSRASGGHRCISALDTGRQAAVDRPIGLPHDRPMSEPTRLRGPAAAPASGRDPRSMVVLLHGYGSNGADLIGLATYWRAILPDTVFMAPNAPQICPGAPGGYQWWSLTDLGRESRAAGVREAAPLVNAFMDMHRSTYDLPNSKVALVGFSQGAMMALHVGPRRSEVLAGVVGYSGMLADADALQTEVATRPPLLLSHGDADEMVPFAAMAQAEVDFKRMGFEISTHAERGLGHSIGEAGLRLGGEFLARVLSRVG